MDLGKRLRKQRERSSLHARQLNKNALSLLHRQLHVLERREQQHARALIRSKQAILDELMDVEKPEHERQARREESQPRQRPWPLLDNPAQEGQAVVQSSFVEHSFAVPRLTRLSDDRRNITTSRVCFDSNTFTSLPCPHGNVDSSQCRFKASILTPCPHFPCSLPHTYHHLKVSEIPNPLSRRVDPDRLQNPVLGPRSATSPQLSDLPGQTLASGGASRGNTAPTRDVRFSDGHFSPRTSVNERLRGLRQLVREMRDKNNEKKPKDWAVNYGEPVSRRILRKPAIPVSDDQVVV